MKDPGMGGLATLGLAVRLAHGPAWIEGVAGAGMTGPDWVPAIEAGVGWTFAAGAVDIGPSARVLHVVARDPMDAFGSANLVLVGVDARFGRDRAPRPRSVVLAAAPQAPRAIVPPPVAERDGDGISDADVGCEVDAEGCEVATDIVVHDDRIVLDDRVLFDFNQARVRSRGRELVTEIAEMWRVHPAWKRMTVEGHADVRGSDAYNQELSQRRADRVKAQLVKNGFDADRIDAVGYGRSRPRDPGDSEEAHHRNRRVEFVIERETVVPQVRAVTP
jgi:outer membrane protein OmpA-like peptidoglycan-associated protein